MYVKRIVYGLCVLFMMTAIFAFSSQTYEQTMKTSDLIVKPIENSVKENSSFDNEEDESKYLKNLKSMLDKAVRKSAHMILFGVLAFFVYMLCKSFGMDDADAIVLALAVCGLYAGTDEFHQRFVENRGSHFSDICFDEMGAVISMTVVRIVIKIKMKFQQT